MKYAIVFVLLMTLALGCVKQTSPQYKYIRDHVVVAVVEKDGTITDVRIFDKVPDADVNLHEDKEVSLTALGTAVLSGQYAARAKGKYVHLSPMDGKVALSGQSVNFRTEINDELLSRIHTFLSSKSNAGDGK
jgi:hypothetical protein